MSERALAVLGLALLGPVTGYAQLSGLPASDALGADDIAGNPTFIGGVANGGGTSHGVW